MIFRRRLWLFTIPAVLLAASFLYYAFSPKPQPPQPVDLADPLTGELQAVIVRTFEIERDIVCVEGTSVALLDEVLADTADYRLSKGDRNRIKAVFGKEALRKAGYLTAQKAYYISMLNPAPAIPTPGLGPTLIPTQPPTHYCPDPPEPVSVLVTQVSSLSDTQAVVRYEYYLDIYDAVLRKIDGRWVITSVRMIYYHGAG